MLPVMHNGGGGNLITRVARVESTLEAWDGLHSLPQSITTVSHAPVQERGHLD